MVFHSCPFDLTSGFRTGQKSQSKRGKERKHKILSKENKDAKDRAMLSPAVETLLS